MGQEDQWTQIPEATYGNEFLLHSLKAEDYVQLSLGRVVTLNFVAM
jgi:hypothetical protein